MLSGTPGKYNVLVDDIQVRYQGSESSALLHANDRGEEDSIADHTIGGWLVRGCVGGVQLAIHRDDQR